MKKIVSILLILAMCLCLFAACGKSDDKGEGASSAAANSSSASSEIVEPNALTVMPEGTEVKLSDDELKAVAAAYADYMTAALKSEGYSVTARFEDDGSVHFDGERTDEAGQVDSIADLNKFASLKECFAYLYNCGQVDLDGNLLVGVSEGVEEIVEETADTAESEAEEVLDEAEAAEGEEAQGDEGAESEPEAEIELSEGDDPVDAESGAASSEAQAG